MYNENREFFQKHIISPFTNHKPYKIMIIFPCQETTPDLREHVSDNKHIMLIHLATSLQSHVYSPCNKRPPALRDHMIKGPEFVPPNENKVGILMTLGFQCHWG